MGYTAHRNDEGYDKAAEDARNAQNNANTIKNTAKALENVGGVPGAIGKGISAADAATGGKSTKMLGKAMNGLNKVAPGGHAVQALSNDLAESGIGDKVGQVAAAKSADKANAGDAAKGASKAADAAKGVGDAASKASDVKIPEKNPQTPSANKTGDADKSKSLPSSSSKGGSKKDNTEVEIAKTPILLKWLLIIFGSSFSLIILPIMLVLAIIFSTGDAAKSFFTDTGDKIVTFFNNLVEDERERKNKKQEDEFYTELYNTQEEIWKDDKVCVDINLIISALTVDVDEEKMADDGQGTDESQEYNKKMKQQIELLAKMQIKRKKYSLDGSRAYTKGKAENSKCLDVSKTVLVDEKNEDLFQKDLLDWFLSWKDGSVNSSSPRFVAGNDEEPFLFLNVKKASREKNYEYNIFYPEYLKSPITNSDGTTSYTYSCPSDYAQAQLRSLNHTDYQQLDIGSLKDAENSVFYWNLVDQFIPDYYKDYLPPEGSIDREEKIKKIAEDIYLLYEAMGPSQNCKKTGKCRSDTDKAIVEASGVGTMNDFIESIAPIAINEMERTGITASVTIAQTILESGWGGSFSQDYGNYHGITAGCMDYKTYSPKEYAGTVLKPGDTGNSCTGNDYWDGTVVAACNAKGEDCQWYRVYDNYNAFENSTRDHSQIILNYGCNTLDGYDEQIKCIKEHGYATDPDYVKKVVGLIKDYNLAQYDIANWDGTIVDMPFEDEKTSCATCDDPKWLQTDPQWATVPLGPGRNDYHPTLGYRNDKTNHHGVGCLVTSLAIVLKQSGVDTTIEGDFNPGTFATELSRINSFSSGGALMSYDKVKQIAPSIEITTGIKYESPEQAADYLSQGYYIVLYVPHGSSSHFVVLCDVDESGELYIIDPGGFTPTGVLSEASVKLVPTTMTLLRVGG